MEAKPPLAFIPPAFNSIVLASAQSALPFLLPLSTNITSIEAEGVETLVKLYEQFQEGKIRFLMAFRHPNTNDPLCMAYLLWKLLPKTARQQGIALKPHLHAHFMYDRGIPLWAGEWVGWLYSHLGGTPIQRGKLDLIGLKSARNLFANSHLPLAAAPEGATNGHNEIISPLEPGIAQLGFWCVEDLRKAQRSEEVFILPIGIQYHFITPPWQELEQLLAQLEIASGITLSAMKNRESNDELSQENSLYQRLYRLGEHLLSLMEEFYTGFYHQTLPKIVTQTNHLENPNALLSERLQNLLNVALRVSEDYFNLTPKGSLIDRCRRLEQAGWDCIYREELKDIETLSSVKRGLADHIAEEANLRMWHMRIVETFVAVTGYYVKEKMTAERFAETTLLLWDLITRMKDDNPFKRPQIGKQKVQMTIGKPISVSAYWEDYQSNRRQTVANLTQTLQNDLEVMIQKG